MAEENKDQDRASTGLEALLLLWGISSSFPLANHFDLPGSEAIVGMFQEPPICACLSLSQDGF